MLLILGPLKHPLKSCLASHAPEWSRWAKHQLLVAIIMKNSLGEKYKWINHVKSDIYISFSSGEVVLLEGEPRLVASS